MGKYLGQPRPGLSPEPFAPGIFSVDGDLGRQLHSSLFFSPDGGQVYFMSQSSQTFQVTPMVMQQQDGLWSEPQAATLPGMPEDVTSFLFASDWSRLYLYASPAAQEAASGQRGSGFWVMEKRAADWSEAQYIGPPAAIDRDDGPLYYSATLPGGRGNADIYRSRYLDGRYTDPENLGPAVNTAAEEYVSCVGSDDGYLIFYRFDGANPSGSGLYLTFYDLGDAWSEPIRLDDELGLELGFAASLSPDERMLFLLDRGRGLYWVDAAAIEQHRPEH
jgi:hypothetical protein